jgi:predicted membrane protein
MKNRNHRQDSNGRVIAGIIIVVAGLLFMFNNMNVLSPELRYYIFSWKTLLIGIGALNLLFSHNRTGGFIMLTVGLVFWIPDIIHVPMHMSRFIWPLAIIAVGLFLLFNSRDSKYNGRFWQNKIRDHQRSGNTDQAGEQSGFSQDDYVDDVAIFGGGSRVITSKNFKGGKLTAIFGGSEIRMHRAKLAPGKQVLDIFFVFGGSEIIVPADWLVKVETVSIFGGFSDKRYVRKPEEVTEENKSVLVIKGLVLFGGAELKSY